MLRYIVAAVAALLPITANLIPDDAFARRGAATAGAYGYCNNGCYQDGYGNYVCLGQHPPYQY